ncbi:MAG: hypothetical protein Q9220_005453 [cf. Caloplaca sp. 1 TL-2023]
MFDASKPPRFASTSKPAEPDPSSGLIQLKVLATGLHRLVRSRASGQHYLSTGGFPPIPGIDGVGETTDGQKVLFLCFRDGGSFAEFINVPHNRYWPLPSALDPVHAAGLLNPALSSWLALTARCDNLPRSFSVLILGATSASGRLAVPLARALGAGRVVGCARNEDALKAMEGLDEYIVLQDSAAKGSTDWSQLGGHVDVILDYVYGPVAVQLLKSLKQEGKVQYVHIGSLAAKDDPSALEISIPGSVLRGKDLTIRGSGLGAWGLGEVFGAIDGLLNSLVTVKDKKIEVRKLEDVETAWKDDTGERLVFVP